MNTPVRWLKIVSTTQWFDLIEPFCQQLITTTITATTGNFRSAIRALLPFPTVTLPFPHLLRAVKPSYSPCFQSSRRYCLYLFPPFTLTGCRQVRSPTNCLKEVIKIHKFYILYVPTVTPPASPSVIRLEHKSLSDPWNGGSASGEAVLVEQWLDAHPQFVQEYVTRRPTPAVLEYLLGSRALPASTILGQSKTSSLTGSTIAARFSSWL